MNKNITKTVGSHGNGNNGEGTYPARPKKGKQDANLRKTGYLRFQIGLILALVLVYLGLEATFYHTEKETPPIGEMETSSLEYYPELNVIRVEKPLEQLETPTKIADPKDFEIVDDDAVTEVGTEFIEKTFEVSGQGVLDPGDIITPSIEPEIEEVPFFKIEEVPIFPGCENAKDKRACFNEMMQKHIVKNFRYPEIAQGMGIEGKVFVFFKIDVDGAVSNIQLRGPAEVLKDEAERLISKLPRMIPGKQRGKAVRVPYSIPINFKLQQ
jgi:protein TonB